MFLWPNFYIITCKKKSRSFQPKNRKVPKHEMYCDVSRYGSIAGIFPPEKIQPNKGLIGGSQPNHFDKY